MIMAQWRFRITAPAELDIKRLDAPRYKNALKNGSHGFKGILKRWYRSRSVEHLQDTSSFESEICVLCTGSKPTRCWSRYASSIVATKFTSEKSRFEKMA